MITCISPFPTMFCPPHHITEEKVAGEKRGLKLNKDGKEQRAIEPDFSLQDVSLEQQYEFMYDNVGGSVGDASQRFYFMADPTSTSSSSSSSTGGSMQIYAPKENTIPAENGEPIVAHQIAPRFAGLHHPPTTSSNTAETRVGNTGPTATATSTSTSTTSQSSSNFRPSSGFRARASLFTATTEEVETVTDAEEDDNDDEEEDDNDEEQEQENNIGTAPPASQTTPTTEDTTQEDQGIVNVAVAAHSPNSFFSENHGQDEGQGQPQSKQPNTGATANDGEPAATGSNTNVNAGSAHLSFYGSHTPATSVAPVTESPATNPPPTPIPTASPTKKPTISATLSTTTGDQKITDEIMEEFTIEEKKDLLGGTYYTSKVSADAVYAEATGSVDLSAKKEEVFASLEPLLSRHLEGNFDNGLLKDYQLTVSYVKAKDAVKQLRVATDSKVYTTQLVIMVVLHVENTSRDKVASVTKTKATEVVQSFFASDNSGLDIFLRVLNAKGIHTKEIQAQKEPHAARDHAMEHGISHITSKNGTVMNLPLRAGSDTSQGLFGKGRATTAIVAALATGLLVILAIGGAKWYNRERRDRLVRGVNAGLGSARYHGGGAVNSIRDRGSGAVQTIKNKVNNLQSRARRSHGYFNFTNSGTPASSVTSDATSKLSYIQPAAIQLRRGRRSHVPVPQESPLEGRQDDADEEDIGPTYDIDLDSDNDTSMVEIHNGMEEDEEYYSEEEDEDEESEPDQYEEPDMISLPNESDYDSSSVSSDDLTKNSRQSSLMERSLDRISIARNKKAVDERMTRIDSFQDDEDHANYTYAAESTNYSPRFVSTMRSVLPNPSFGMTQQSFAPLSTAHAPLSPLTAALEQALADSPKPFRHTASKPPEPPIPTRRGIDPPETSSFATQEYYYGTPLSPPTSMQDILDEEYINKARWQEDSEDESVRLPDHHSRFSAASPSTREEDMQENRLIVLPDEEMTTRPYTYRY